LAFSILKGYNKSAVLNTRKYKGYKNETVQQRIQEKVDVIITVGFGAGLTFGGNLIIW
jgi:hypothetical protein